MENLLEQFIARMEVFMEDKDKKTERLKEYLRLKKLEEDDVSDEIIEEVYSSFVKREEDEEIDER